MQNASIVFRSLPEKKWKRKWESVEKREFYFPGSFEFTFCFVLLSGFNVVEDATILLRCD